MKQKNNKKNVTLAGNGMKTTTILFDLDGTLLPMEQEKFGRAYMKGLIAAAEPAGYHPKLLYTSFLDGLLAMVNNNGDETNECVFWNTFEKNYGDSVSRDIRLFDEYYDTAFQEIKNICGFTPKAAELVNHIKEKGFRIVLATNPLFPRAATESRIRWTGIDPEVFELVTTYENSHFCKPNLNYYSEILNKLHVLPEECLMIGNDVSEDMITEQMGMKVFLLTDCLINRDNTDISIYPQGNMDDLFEYIDELAHSFD